MHTATAASALGLAVLCAGVAAAEPAAAVPALPRLAVRDGRFVEKESGRPFVPLGVNYFRTGKVASGKVVHATFCPGFYDRLYVERMLAEVAGWGCTAVRTFQAYHVGEEGILTSPEAREISPAYLANVVHFLRQAQAHRLRVIFSWDVWLPTSTWWAAQPLPGEAGRDLRPEWDESFGVNNFRLGLTSIRTRVNAIVALIEALRREDPGLLSTVLSWELENEVFFGADRAPFLSRQGRYRFAGREYDLASDAETQALMDDVIVQWADLGAEAIHRADPDALVSAGVFTFNAVGRGGPGTLSTDQTKDERIPARPVALLRSKLDYIDIHLYAWRSAEQGAAAYLARNLASVEWSALRPAARQAGKPILCGESGLFASTLRSPPGAAIDHTLGLACLREHQQGLAAAGLAGTLYWHYGNPDSGPTEETPALALFPAYAKVLTAAWAPPAKTVFAHFYYWYPINAGICTHHAPPGHFDRNDPQWWMGELRQAHAAGIDVLTLMYWDIHDYNPAALGVLLEAVRRLEAGAESHPQVALHLDGIEHVANLRRETPLTTCDLTDPAAQDAVAQAAVRFFRFFKDQGRLDLCFRRNGRLVAFVYRPEYGGIQARADDALVARWQQRFREALGEDVYLVMETAFAQTQYPPTATDLHCGNADNYYRWDASLHGALLETRGEFPIATIGPGWDVSGREPQSARRRDRRNGEALREDFAKALQWNAPWLVIETFNFFEEGSEITETREFGRLYLDLTRDGVQRFKGGR